MFLCRRLDNIQIRTAGGDKLFLVYDLIRPCIRQNFAIRCFNSYRNSSINLGSFLVSVEQLQVRFREIVDEAPYFALGILRYVSYPAFPNPELRFECESEPGFRT